MNLNVNSNVKIVHIITRFMIEYKRDKIFFKKIYTKHYISNGIMLMKKYLLYSLVH